jgi:hypothetical protein
MLGDAYWVHTVVMLGIAGLGFALRQRRAHLVLALIALAYQASYFLLEYFTLASD